MGIMTTSNERIYRATRVVVRPDKVRVTVEFAVNYGLNDGTLRVVETYSRLGGAQFIGAVVDGMLIMETIARTVVNLGQPLDPEYDDLEFAHFSGSQKLVARRGKGSSKITIEVGPGGCEYAFIEPPLA